MEMTDRGGIGNPAFDGDDIEKKEREFGEGLKVSPTDAPLKETPLRSCYSKVFSTAIGLVIFLSWAAAMQVSLPTYPTTSFQKVICLFLNLFRPQIGNHS